MQLRGTFTDAVRHDLSIDKTSTSKLRFTIGTRMHQSIANNGYSTYNSTLLYLANTIYSQKDPIFVLIPDHISSEYREYFTLTVINKSTGNTLRIDDTREARALTLLTTIIGTATVAMGVSWVLSPSEIAALGEGSFVYYMDFIHPETEASTDNPLYPEVLFLPLISRWIYGDLVLT